METSIVNPNKIAFKWAAIYVLIAIIITYITQLAHMNPDSPVKYIGYIPFIAFLFLVQKEYKDHLGGYISFGEAFGAGFKYALFGGIMLGIFIFIYLTWLNPGMLDQAMAAQQDKLQAQGLTQDQIDTSMTIARKYGPVIGLFGTILGECFFGAILGLIGATIFKNEKPMFTGDDYQPIEP